MMQVTEKEGFHVIGIEVVSDWKGLHQEMPIKWKLFKERVHEIKGRHNDKMMDMSLECDGERYKQLIGVEVDDTTDIPPGMVKRMIPAQTYIHHRHTGTLKDISQTFGQMYQWAKENGYEAGDFKIDDGYSSHGDDEGHDLYIQIK